MFREFYRVPGNTASRFLCLQSYENNDNCNFKNGSDMKESITAKIRDEWCLRWVSTIRTKNALRVCIFTFFLLLILQIGAWRLPIDDSIELIDDSVEPLGAYDSIFCHPKDLVGRINIRKAMN